MVQWGTMFGLALKSCLDTCLPRVIFTNNALHTQILVKQFWHILHLHILLTCLICLQTTTFVMNLLLLLAMLFYFSHYGILQYFNE